MHGEQAGREDTERFDELLAVERRDLVAQRATLAEGSCAARLPGGVRAR